MPTYDYQCRACGTVTEVIHSMLEDGPAVCERCGGALRRVIFPSGIIFKGSGFYRNDSRAGGSGQESGGPEKAPASATDGTSKAAGTGSGSTSDAGSSASTSPSGSGEG